MKMVFLSLILALIGISSSTSLQVPRTSDIECHRLKGAHDSVFLPKDPQYELLRLQNWSGTAKKSPACVFKPGATSDLARALKQLQQSNVKFAIRSGGHLPSPDAANIDDGILIDLGGFNEVDYDKERRVATIGSGLRWGEVYEKLDQFNVTVVGGRVLDVGVGGLILGGGLSYLSDSYGLACDNVVNFEVILGSGHVVNANETHNEDLFWALKGGGNNFGIVTRFTLSAYHVPRVWGGVKAYNLEDLPALHNAMYEYQTTPRKDPKANLMLQGYVSNVTIGIVLNLIYLAPEDSPDAFEPFYHINTTADTTKISSLHEFYTGQGPINFPPRVDWRTTSFRPDRSIYGQLGKVLTDSVALQRIRSVQSGTVAFGLQPISATAIEAGIRRGNNALGLQNINQTWYVIDSGWTQAVDDQEVHDATKDMVNSIRAQAESANKQLSYIFANDASYDQDVIGSYGQENVAKLKAVSAKYDPQQVFQKLVPGGFKLPTLG